MIPTVIKFIDKKQHNICQEQGETVEWGLLFNGFRVPIWEDKKVLKMAGSDSCTTL